MAGMEMCGSGDQIPQTITPMSGYNDLTSPPQVNEDGFDIRF